MIKRLSFCNHIIVNILNKAGDLIPGIERVIGIYYEPVSQSVCAMESIPGESKIQGLDLKVDSAEIKKERKNSSPSSWTSQEYLFFKIRKNETKQLSINDEYKNHVLIIRVANSHDGMYDILVFFFKENLGTFGLSRIDDSMSTSNKTIIKSMVFNMVNYIRKQNMEDLVIYTKSIEAQTQTADNYHKMKAELKATRENYGQSIIQYCKHHLSKISTDETFEYCLSSAAEHKLSTFDNRFEYLESILENAASVALNKNIYSSDLEIIIHDTDIVFHNYEKTQIIEESTTYNRHFRTEAFLDKYELAAEKVLNNHLPLTSKNVGKYCSPPVSAAAISDALKNHMKAIAMLFEKYPDRWLLIRNNFRPIRNILTENRKDYYQAM